MMRKRLFFASAAWGSAACLTILLSAGPAEAVTVPVNASYSASVSGFYPNAGFPTLLAGTHRPGAVSGQVRGTDANARASVSGASGGTVAISGSTASAEILAQSYVRYQFYLLSATPAPRTVGVHITARGDTTGTPCTSAEFTIDGYLGVGSNTVCQEDSNPIGAFLFDGVVNLPIDTLFSVSVIVSADTGQEHGSFSAFVDPTYRIDPALFPGVTLVFSPGVGNGPDPIPAPGGLALIGGALVVIGAFRKSRGESR